MLNDTINKISNAYMAEALNSPTLMEDMAAMEKYMAESYSGRIFIELLQNADDCGSTNVLVQEYDNHIVFANNGRPFDDNDIISISRSGASKKERGSQIGYRGIGFKSTAYLTEEIIIFSNNTYFTFSKSECSKRLNKPKEQLPTVRIPFILDNIDSELSRHILDISKYYSTIFVFKNAKMDQFENEIGNLSEGYFMFLRNICTCSVQMNKRKAVYTIQREKDNGYEILTFESGERKKWLITRKNNVALALRLSNGQVIACDSEESIYHCFLPTLDKSPYPFKINADFSTDPSRKHITQDSLTDNAINSVVVLIYETLEKAIEEECPMFSQFFDIITSVYSFSPRNQQVTNKLEKLIKGRLKLKSTDNKLQLISSFKSFPDYFENSEKSFMRSKSQVIAAKSISKDYYTCFPTIDAFIEKYSDDKFTPDEISQTLSENDFVKSLGSQMYARIFSFVAASIKISKLTNKDFKLSNEILIPTYKGVISAKQISTHDTQIIEEVKNAISESAKSNDLELICKDIGITPDVIIPSSPTNKLKLDFPSKKDNVIVKVDKPVVSRWRSAEQQCVELEVFFGNNAIDVSRQNVGYDIESTTPEGNKRFVEVKLIPNLCGSFSLTNNEYTAAHQHGDNYYICLIFQREQTADALYINNPLKNLRLEKRIRQWEWYCEDYSGEKYIIDLK